MKKITVPSYREDNYYDRVALNHTPTKEPPVAFLVLTFLLSVPFYILNALAYRNAVLTPTVALPAVFLFFCILAAGIFTNTGKSVFAAILFHASDNTALVTLPEVQAITPGARS
ncbi:MAG: hypothetical protein WBP34_16765 [Thermoanaerobaculia bacterium]